MDILLIKRIRYFLTIKLYRMRQTKNIIYLYYKFLENTIL